MKRVLLALCAFALMPFAIKADEFPTPRNMVVTRTVTKSNCPECDLANAMFAMNQRQQTIAAPVPVMATNCVCTATTGGCPCVSVQANYAQPIVTYTSQVTSPTVTYTTGPVMTYDSGPIVIRSGPFARARARAMARAAAGGGCASCGQ